MSSDESSLRWLGVAGVEIIAGVRRLAIDPFFTRPPLWNQFIGHPATNTRLVSQYMTRCQHILVTHPHYDHLMDVPAIVQSTGADVYGSAHTCRLLDALGVPAQKIHLLHDADTLNLGDFQVQARQASHPRTPLDWLLNGDLPRRLHPPLRLTDYRMDVCFSYSIRIGDITLLHGPQPVPADIWLCSPYLPRRDYPALLDAIRPRLVIPIHWEDFFQPITHSLSPLLPWATPTGFKTRIEKLQPTTRVLIPRLMEKYPLGSLV